MIRILCCVVFLIAAGQRIAAQENPGMLERLAMPDSVYGSQVLITEHAGVRNTHGKTQPVRFNGYRVRIFFDNSQHARQHALATKSAFEELYPGIPAYITYENPYFKVSVGNCTSQEEAVTLWGKIKERFDRAFVIREEIALEELIR